MVNLSTITQNIQKSKNISHINININKSFLQTENIPIHSVPAKVNIPKSKFVKDQIIELPEFYNNFVDHNNYYLYGSPNLFHSVLFIIDENFRLGSINKQNELENFKLMLLQNINQVFTQNKNTYAEKNIKKGALEIYIKELDFSKDIKLDNGIFQLIADVKKINITILDDEKKLFEYYESSTNNNDNIILLYFENKIIPLLNIYGNLFLDDDIDTIKTYFKPKLKLNKITSYKLNDLQLLGNNNNISITNNGKNKNKQQLYNELLMLT